MCRYPLKRAVPASIGGVLVGHSATTVASGQPHFLDKRLFLRVSLPAAKMRQQPIDNVCSSELAVA